MPIRNDILDFNILSEDLGTYVRNADLSLNLQSKDVSIRIKESQSTISMLIAECLWGEAMFGEECILGVPYGIGTPANKSLWGAAAFGEIGILGEPGSSAVSRTFRTLNIIRIS
jgi:hypothetical protein